MEHGTTTKYNRGCRCDDCRAARTEYERARRKRRRAEPMPDKVHGTLQGYIHYGCRCDDCRTKMKSYRHQYNAKHGTWTRYWQGCRCEQCVAAYRADRADRKQRFAGKEPPSHGTVYAYDVYKCRCDRCRRALATKARAQRARKKEVT